MNLKETYDFWFNAFIIRVFFSVKKSSNLNSLSNYCMTLFLTLKMKLFLKLEKVLIYIKERH